MKVLSSRPRSKATCTKTVPHSSKVQHLVIRELGGNRGPDTGKSLSAYWEISGFMLSWETPGVIYMVAFTREHGSRPGPEPLASDPKCVLDSLQGEEDRRKGG